MAALLLPACETEREVTTTTTEETTAVHPAVTAPATTTETRTIRSY
jgi:hypothetical protein